MYMYVSCRWQMKDDDDYDDIIVWSHHIDCGKSVGKP